ncbi:hypothetical protein [Schleiferilactobacillus shenzhenensis]|uniref:Uncharacterized protein n=1 Tax=Schleiferilactobacillus shenzhenensis LY-73 TaxID=1231336 RepID=U4TIW0_9LACO|nr:hypothetical protein [Schleiferilactobacillus shenzhenensis]ERL64139.1 hypothetical protein L248_1581 [Schleiferilactobacillus shenzhenensis LY-73]
MIFDKSAENLKGRFKLGIRKSKEETIVVGGGREQWMQNMVSILTNNGFKKVDANAATMRVTGDYHKATTYGGIEAILTPVGDSQTQIQLIATANVDNVYALFTSPTQKILDKVMNAIH